MRRLFAKIMILLACIVVMMHAMIPHHQMSCGWSRLYLTAPYVHYGVCEASDDCYEVLQNKQCNSHNGMCNEPHGHDSDGSPLNQCKIQELLSRLLISSHETEIHLAIVCTTVLDLFFNEIKQEAVATFIPVANREWLDYVVMLPIQGGISDAPLRAPPVC